MNIAALLCLGIFGILFLTFFKKGTDIFSPGRLFIMIWMLAIGLTELKLSRYQKNWSIYSWVMLSIPLVSMALGMFTVYVLKYGRKMKSIRYIRDSVITQRIDPSMLYLLSRALFCAYIISYIVSYLFIGYVPLFTATPDITRTTWGVFGLGLFIQSIPALLYSIALYFFLVKGRTQSKIVLGFAMTISFLTYLLLLQRYYIVLPFFLSIVFLYYATNKLRAKNIFFSVIIGSFIMYGVSLIRLSRYALNFIYYLSKMKYGIKYAFFTEPYMYVVMNLENFANSVAKLTKYTYGLGSFDFVLALIGLKYPLKEYMFLEEYPNLITNTYNTYTMFFVYYRDYGMLGLFVFPFILGLLFSHVYYKMRFTPSINTVSIYAMFSFVIVFSFFVPIITYLHFVFNLFLIYLITNLISAKSTLQISHIRE